MIADRIVFGMEVLKPSPSTPPPEQSEGGEENYGLPTNHGVSDCCKSQVFLCTAFQKWECKKCRRLLEVGDIIIPPKAEGVGEKEWIKEFTERFTQVGHSPSTVDYPEEWEWSIEVDDPQEVVDFIQDLLTSAVRAAEERKDGEMLDFCLSICANDKTPRYGYDGKKERNANAYGQFPDGGRWCTPNEMAADRANMIKNKRKSLQPPPDLSTGATAEEDKPTQL